MTQFKYDDKKVVFNEGEPWFLVRAQDILSHWPLLAYEDALRSVNMHDQADEIQQLRKAFAGWQGENRDKVKYPD